MDEKTSNLDRVDSLTSRSGTVLLIDDDRDQLFVYQTLLELRGHQVIPCSSGREAIQILEQRPVEVIVCDVLMPDMSGEEFIQRAKAVPGAASIPIITFTAGSGDLRSKVMMAGASEFLEKTSAAHELPSRIIQHLSLRS